MNITLNYYYPNEKTQNANYSSALYKMSLLLFRFNAGLAIGELIGPIAGGYVVKYVSYQRSFSILGLLMLGFNVFYCPLIFMNFD